MQSHEPIGQLVRAARAEHRYSQLEFARRAGINAKTLRDIETGVKIPLDATRDRIEEALGWKPGIMRELWDERVNIDLNTVTLDYMKAAGTKTVAKASQLTHEELTSELAYRLRTQDEEIRKLKDQLT